MRALKSIDDYWGYRTAHGLGCVIPYRTLLKKTDLLAALGHSELVGTVLGSAKPPVYSGSIQQYPRNGIKDPQLARFIATLDEELAVGILNNDPRMEPFKENFRNATPDKNGKTGNKRRGRPKRNTIRSETYGRTPRTLYPIPAIETQPLSSIPTILRSEYWDHFNANVAMYRSTYFEACQEGDQEMPGHDQEIMQTFLENYSGRIMPAEIIKLKHLLPRDKYNFDGCYRQINLVLFHLYSRLVGNSQSRT